MRRIFLTLLFIGGLCGVAQAWMDTAQLQSMCENGLSTPSIENPRYAMCTGMIIGILMADALEQERICVPSNLDTKTSIEVFITRAASEKHKDIEGAVTMYQSLLEKFPCPK